MGQVVALSGCLVALLTFAVAPAPASPGAQPAQARVAAGKAAFGASCSSDYCHGPEGDGGGAPSLRERRYSPQFLTQVITVGVPSTAMPGFNKDMTSEQIEQMVAYVLSLSPAGAAAAGIAAPAAPASRKAARPIVAAPPIAPSSSPLPPMIASSPAAAGEVRGDPAAGRAIFFDAGRTENCRFCHTLGDRGGQAGPDLTKTATRPARDLFLSIVAPRPAAGSAFAAVAVTMKDGQRFIGVKRDETPDTLRLYDTSSVPPVLRSLLKTSVEAITGADVPAMPGDYASRYSLKQLLDLVAFVKSMDPTSRASVTLKDLF